MITNYTVISDVIETGLVVRVREYILAGWQPLGGVTLADMHDIHSHPHYAQALVKYTEDTP